MTRVAFSLETNELLGQVDFVLDRLACMIGYHYQFGTKEEEKKEGIPAFREIKSQITEGGKSLGNYV